eukprot:7445173-Lingulodinium_polyedra.AAC.1
MGGESQQITLPVCPENAAHPAGGAGALGVGLGQQPVRAQGGRPGVSISRRLAGRSRQRSPCRGAALGACA